MPKPNPHEVTQLLLAWSEGDKAATALIHEAYLRLVDASQLRLENRWRLARSWLLRLLRGGKPDEA